MIDNIIKLLEILAWPLTAIGLGFMFRKEFRLILSRISKVKYKEIEVSIDKELTEIENSSKELAPKMELSKSIRDNYYTTYNRLLEIAKVSPRAAISESWRELEISTALLLNELGHDSKNVVMSKIFRNILNDNDYPSSLYTDYKKLRDLRNKAVHAEDFEISQSDAERYIVSALDISIFIQKLKHNSNQLK